MTGDFMKLSDLIDIQRLQVIIDHLFASNGIPIAIFNPDSSVVVSTPWRDVCSKFHRVNGITCQRCIESDRELNRIIKETGKYAISKCRNGLIDIGAPIIINDEQIAMIYQGQFFLKNQISSILGNKDFLQTLMKKPTLKLSRKLQ